MKAISALVTVAVVGMLAIAGLAAWQPGDSSLNISAGSYLRTGAPLSPPVLSPRPSNAECLDLFEIGCSPLPLAEIDECLSLGTERCRDY